MNFLDPWLKKSKIQKKAKPPKAKKEKNKKPKKMKKKSKKSKKEADSSDDEFADIDSKIDRALENAGLISRENSNSGIGIKIYFLVYLLNAVEN